MKRREFLKLGLGASAIVAVPALANESTRQLKDAELLHGGPVRTTSKLSIKDWINTPYALELERGFKKQGMLPADSSWDDFEFTDSDKAYEEYGPYQLTNVSYALYSYADNADERLMRFMSNTLYSLRVRALSAKLEGVAIGGGRLILQSRMAITIEPETDLKKSGARRITWRGSIDRIPN